MQMLMVSANNSGSSSPLTLVSWGASLVGVSTVFNAKLRSNGMGHSYPKSPLGCSVLLFSINSDTGLSLKLMDRNTLSLRSVGVNGISESGFSCDSRLPPLLCLGDQTSQLDEAHPVLGICCGKQCKQEAILGIALNKQPGTSQ